METKRFFFSLFLSRSLSMKVTENWAKVSQKPANDKFTNTWLEFYNKQATANMLELVLKRYFGP